MHIKNREKNDKITECEHYQQWNRTRSSLTENYIIQTFGLWEQQTTITFDVHPLKSTYMHSHLNTVVQHQRSTCLQDTHGIVPVKRLSVCWAVDAIELTIHLTNMNSRVSFLSFIFFFHAVKSTYFIAHTCGLHTTNNNEKGWKVCASNMTKCKHQKLDI